MLDQRRRRLAYFVQMLCKCLVRAEESRRLDGFVELNVRVAQRRVYSDKQIHISTSQRERTKLL